MLRADAIVVLGCRVAASGQPAPAAARRAARAAQAYLDGVAPVVVASGGRRWGANVEARALSRELIQRGVPPSAIIEELCSFSTYENAVFAAAILGRIRAGSAAIVTCGWHMDRALMNFRAAGVEAHAVPANGPDASWTTRVRCRVQEHLSSIFDARAMRRVGVYRRAALRGIGPMEFS